MTTILQDVRHAVRACWKSPGFAAAAILTLALGIGVNIAVFTVLNAALLERMPVENPDRLVHIYTWTPQGGDHFDFSYPLYVDLRDNNRVLSGLAAYLSSAVGLTAGARSERVIAEFVTANYFQVLGVRLRIGPGFSGEDELRGGPPTAIVSHGVWQDLFGGDGSIVGKSVLVNGAAFTIVGVAPQEFEGITRGQRSGVWLTIPQFFAVRSRPATAMDLRTTSFLALVGRLPPATTTERVEQEMTTAVRTLASVPGAGDWHVRTRPASSGNTGLVDPLETPLRMLMVAVGLILVIAAANVANLFLARSYARQREVAVRQALGATRARIVQQLVTEAAVPAVAGGAVGLLLAGWITAFFEIRTPLGPSALALGLEPNLTVLLFTAAVTTVAALVAGLLPAFTTSRPNLLVVIKGGGELARTHGTGRTLRSALVILQIALSLVLAVGGGLFLRSLGKLRSIDPSLADPQVLAATVNPTLRGYDEQRGRRFYEDLLARVRSVPGVHAAGLAYVLPVTSGGIRMDVGPRTTRPEVETAVRVEVVPVSSGFFETVGVPLLAGRDFGAADREGAPPAAIVNETLKKQFWPNRDAVGQTFTIGGATYDIVGVARDTKYRSLRETPRMSMYLPLAQSYETSANLVVRTALPADNVVGAIRAELRQIDPAMPLYNVRTLAEHVNRSLYLDRLRAELVSWLATLALALAAIGIYGVVSFTVAERTREMGIRLALGAEPGRLLRLVLMSGVRFAAAGIALGLLLSLWLTRIVAAELYGVSRTDGVTLATTSALLMAIVVLASFVPAYRAMRTDPISALRQE